MPSIDQRTHKNWWRGKWLPRFVAVLAGLWLAWTVVANTAADNLANTDAEEALSWRNTSSAMVSLARQKLIADGLQENAADIRRLAEDALRTAPLQSRALAMLALLAETEEGQERAGRLMKLAADRSRRDGLVEVWSFYRAAKLGEFDRAVAHADAVLRSRPNLRDQIAPTLISFAMDNEAKSAVVGILAQQPPWRGWYLGELAKQTDDPGLAYGVYADLGKTSQPPNDKELGSYLNNLIGAVRFDQAYLTWINFLPEDRRRNIRFAYNGDFEYLPTGLPFDWSIAPVAGASTEIVERNDIENGHAVRVEFANRRVGYRHLRKLMMLPPGPYQLTGSAMAQDLENERGLVWRVSCAEMDRQRLAETVPIKGTTDWHEISIGFEVPQTGCRAQWLTLELAARVALEEQIGGEVWFDDLAVTRISQKNEGESPDKSPR